MEATREELGLLDKILPPKLEDAALDILEGSVKLKAAAAILTGDEDAAACVNDPWPGKSSPSSDVLVGVVPEGDAPGECAAKKGGPLIGEEGAGEDMVGGRNEEEAEMADAVVVVPVETGGTDCVDGLRGLKIKEEKESEDDEERERDGGEKPTLVEGYLPIAISPF